MHMCTCVYVCRHLCGCVHMHILVCLSVFELCVQVFVNCSFIITYLITKKPSCKSTNTHRHHTELSYQNKKQKSPLYLYPPANLKNNLHPDHVYFHTTTCHSNNLNNTHTHTHTDWQMTAAVTQLRACRLMTLVQYPAEPPGNMGKHSMMG